MPDEAWYDVVFDPHVDDPNLHPWELWGCPMRCERGMVEEVEELFRLEFEGAEVRLLGWL